MNSKLKHKKQSMKPKGKTEVLEWTVEENELLISRMLSVIQAPDILKYRVTLDRIKWNDIAFGRFSGNDCKLKWNHIFKEIRKTRTLTEILQDAKEFVKDPYKGQVKKHPDYPKRPLTPYLRFFVDNRVDYAKQHTTMNNLEVTAELSKLYRKLSPSVKEKYAEQWKKETAVYKKAMAKFKEEHPEYFYAIKKQCPKEPRQPAVIYKDEKIDQFSKAHPEMKVKECTEALKNEYKKLSDDEKLKFIEKTLKEEEQYDLETQKYNEAHPEATGLKKKRSKVTLNKEEIKLNDKFIGRPKKPPSNGYNLFCTEKMSTLSHMSSKNRIVECGRLWNLKTTKEKEALHARCLQMKKEYEENYSNFYQKLTPEQREKEQENSMKNKSTKKRAASSGTEASKRAKIEKDDSSSSETDDTDDSSDSDDDMTSDNDDDEDDDDEDSEESEDEESETEVEKKDEEDEKFRRLAPARPTTPISALFLYQKAQRKKVEAQYPSMSSDEITRLLARRYHELPEHKRHKYMLKEKEQRSLYNEKMQQYLKEGKKKNGDAEVAVEKPQAITGEEVYHDKNIENFLKKHKSKPAAEAALRTSWNKMNKVKKEFYIQIAQQENEKKIAAYTEQTASCKNNKVTTEVTKTKKAKFSNQKVKFENEPKKPPASGYQLYSSTHMSSLNHLAIGERSKELGRLWKELDDQKKKAFTEEAKRRNEKYKKELATWLQQLPPDVAAQYKVQHSKKQDANIRPTDGTDSLSNAKSVAGDEEDSSDTEDTDDSSSDEESDEDSSSSDSDDSDSSSSSNSDSSDDDDASSSS